MTQVSRRPTPDEAQALLAIGNKRFVEDKAIHPRQDAAHIAQLAGSGQNPIATIVGCSDSRVPVERLFDQGVGDLFVIRTAGHVMGDVSIASAEYSVRHLDVPLVVILGHTGCGAVTAAVQGTQENDGSMPALLASIEPAVRAARESCPSCQPEELINEAVEAHVGMVLRGLLESSAIIREAIDQGRVRLAGGIYYLSSGLVEWLD